MTANYWNQLYPSTRRPVLAKNVVTTSQPLAAQAGLEMLQRGGNAMDAALAAAITLTVVEPTSNGIGGDAFVLFNQGDQLIGLNASGKSPKKWSRKYFSEYTTMPHSGWDTVTVPGAVSAWVECSRNYGKLEFADLFEPAIRHALEGFLVSPVTANSWALQVDHFNDREDLLSTFAPGGRAPRAGELFKNPCIAKTLHEVSESKGEAFYRGDLAEKIVAHSKAQGGAMELEDLHSHRVEWVSPLSIDVQNFDLYELPPNGQGLAALIALGICRYFNLESLTPESSDALHIQLEAMKLAFADLHSHVSDPAFMQVLPQSLLDPDYLKQRAKQINMKQAAFPQTGVPLPGGTVYLCCGDQAGMMVSFIQSNFTGFGSGVVVPETGISLQNRGACFVLDKNHPNCVDGGKRPLHTIIPAMIYQDNQPRSAFGVMGGHMQAQGHLQMVLRFTFWKQNPQTALDAPRWMINRPDDIWIEEGIDPTTLDDLKDRGHQITIHPIGPNFGGGQCVWKIEDGYLAASEPRKDGQAVGF